MLYHIPTFIFYDFTLRIEKNLINPLTGSFFPDIMVPIKMMLGIVMAMAILYPFFLYKKRGNLLLQEEFDMNNKKSAQEYPVHILREQLRQRAADDALFLSRSVSRLTSCDAQPCLEYRDEVTAEYGIIDRLLYTQQCRACLERCIGQGCSRLRYRWRDGRVTETSFRRVAPGRVKVFGLLRETARPLPQAG